MKKIFTLILLMPLFCKAQFFVYGGGTYSFNNEKGGSIGIGNKKGSGSGGIAAYYSEVNKLSVHADLHYFIDSSKNAFLFFQPGWALIENGQLSLKTGAGIMAKSTGLYFHAGYGLLIISRQKYHSGFVKLGIKI